MVLGVALVSLLATVGRLIKIRRLLTVARQHLFLNISFDPISDVLFTETIKLRQVFAQIQYRINGAFGVKRVVVNIFNTRPALKKFNRRFYLSLVQRLQIGQQFIEFFGTLLKFTLF